MSNFSINHRDQILNKIYQTLVDLYKSGYKGTMLSELDFRTGKGVRNAVCKVFNQNIDLQKVYDFLYPNISMKQQRVKLEQEIADIFNRSF